MPRRPTPDDSSKSTSSGRDGPSGVPDPRQLFEVQRIPDHYRVLGVGVRATTEDIKVAYRKLSRVYHPDRHQQAGALRGANRAEEAFKLIAAAYAELSDPARRQNYDRLLTLRDPLRLVDDPRAERALDVLDLVVNRLRKKPEALPGAKRGRDLRVVQPIAFVVAALGGSVAVTAAYETVCRTCRGQGTTEPQRNPVCHACQGSGLLKVGLRRQDQPCGFCDGRGAVLLAPCATCAGSAAEHIERKVTITVPQRVRDGQVLRVRGAGEQPVLGGPAGDLVVELQVRPHPLLTADGDDLVCQVPLRFSQAAMGTRVSVPTLEGIETLTLPAGVTTGTTIRIAGRGLPGVTVDRRGALRVVVQVDAAAVISAAHGAVLTAFEAALPAGAFARVSAYEQALTSLPQADAETTAPRTETSSA